MYTNAVAAIKTEIKKQLENFEKKELEDLETDCSICYNMLVESCVLPCRHRYCVQCMRTQLSHSTACPLCRAQIPEYFKNQYYYHNIDKEFQSLLSKKFPLQYEQEIHNFMKADLPSGQKYFMSFEVGQYYMGYQNPSNVIDHEQRFKKSEWTVFIRTKNPTFRPYISQFIDFVDFNIPKKPRALTVKPPEQHYNNL